jgi:hypothetical protein
MEVDFNFVKTRKDVEDMLAEKIDNPRIRQFLLKNLKSDKHTHQLKWKLNVEALYNYLEEIVEGGNYRRFRRPDSHHLLPCRVYKRTGIKYIKEEDLSHKENLPGSGCSGYSQCRSLVTCRTTRAFPRSGVAMLLNGQYPVVSACNFFQKPPVPSP